MKRLVLGAAAGVNAGYLAVRAVQAARELRSPSPVRPRDAKSYGVLRRKLMLTGMLRSLAGLGAWAYVAAPRLEPPEGAPESRLRRLTLVGGGFLASTLASLPIEFVEGYALERRYGLTEQTPQSWLADRAKAGGVSFAILVPLVELLATAIARAPRTWPAIATGGALPLLVLGNVVAPNLIMPLFNRFEPLEGELETKLRELAARFDAGDAAILRVDMSKQTTKANAYVTGLFGSKRIVIGDTLLANFEDREVAFVVAHELGHYVTKDVWRSVALGTGAAAVLFFGARALAVRGGGAERSLGTTAGLARLFFALSLLELGLGPMLSAASRSRERAADEFALAATSDPSGGAAAFARLRDQNMAEDEQPKWMELLFSSHPSLKSRIERLESAVAGARA